MECKCPHFYIASDVKQHKTYGENHPHVLQTKNKPPLQIIENSYIHLKFPSTNPIKFLPFSYKTLLAIKAVP